MSDPFEILKNLDEGDQGAPLAASEIRLRGDRMRRRRVAARVVGAACVVAVIGTGGIALGSPWTGPTTPNGPARSLQPAGGHEGSASPSPSPTPTEGPEPVVTAIPQDFPLAVGYPDTGSDDELVGPGPDVRAFDDVGVCGRPVYPTADPVERLAATYTAPEDIRSRELTTYPDVATAREALENLVNGHRDCPRESFGGTPESVTLTHVRRTRLGSEGFAIVQTYEVGGARALGLGQIQVVRVGNALLLSATSSEATGDHASVIRNVRSQIRALEPVVSAMCVFSPAGCAADPRGSGLDAALVTVEDIRDLTGELQTDWAQEADREDPTLDCQADWLSSLGADRLAYREFAGTAATGTVNSESAAAVLEFTRKSDARTAYDTLASWIDTCRTPLGRRPVSLRHDPVTVRTAHGPATWRVLESPAPEICTECDTGWIDAQGVALVGNRVTLLSIAYTGDLGSGADTASSPMVEGIRAAADLAAGGGAPGGALGASSTIGPFGVGDLELGMDVGTPPASRLVRKRPGEGPCQVFVLKALGPRDDGVDGFANENLGVMALFAREEMTTPEGIGLGSTLAEVRAAYPAAEEGVHSWTVPVAGFEDRSYEFLLEDGAVVELVLELDAQTCFG